MFVKITTSGPRKYVKLVEAFRDAQGVPRQRVIATLGRLEELQGGKGDALLNGLLRASGKPTLAEGTGSVSFDPALTIGDTWMLHALWSELGFADTFGRLLRRRRKFNPEHLLRVMVFNRLCDPESKLGILRWLEGTRVPKIDPAAVTHQHLLSTMDTLTDCADAIESLMAKQLRPLLDQDLSIVFYDLTTIRTEGRTQQEGDLRRYGCSKDGGIARQVMLGVVQTADGLPIHHEVFEGNTAETKTLVPTIERVLKRYPIKRIILVADRGLLSVDNLEQISAIRVGSRPLEFILAVPARRYSDFEAIIGKFHRDACQASRNEVFGEFEWQDNRLIVAHRPDLAAELGRRRDARIEEMEQEAQRLVGKLDGQDEGKRFRGRKLSDGGVTARFYKAVSDAHLSTIIKIDLNSDVFRYSIDDTALDRARLLDGKLLLVTNVPDLSPEAIVHRYKSLADIERGFRVLKSEIEIAPVFHRKPERIRVHALICFLALVLHRVLRLRLKASNSRYSPERALEIARRIQFHRVTLNDREQASGLSRLTPEQHDLFESIDLPIPATAGL